MRTEYRARHSNVDMYLSNYTFLCRTMHTSCRFIHTQCEVDVYLNVELFMPIIELYIISCFALCRRIAALPHKRVQSRLCGNFPRKYMTYSANCVSNF